ncbi:MAG: DUF4956 domain-containing protein [Oscillospiraceae bacterium]|nr:DUF4956 domain-containing protein [Oscillospiraceae bacterium]
MSVNDIFRGTFLAEFASFEMSMRIVATSLITSTILALYIFFIYRAITKKTFYSKTFNLSLAAITVIITSVMIAIQSNIILTLGMVGALSIVRFRTPVKDPMDLMFLFWAISAGIITGARLPEIAFITSLLLTVLIFVLNAAPVGKAPMLLVINSSDSKMEKEIISTIKKYTKYYKVKSRSITKNVADMVIELRVKDASGLIQKISEYDYIVSASLISHDGEATF